MGVTVISRHVFGKGGEIQILEARSPSYYGLLFKPVSKCFLASLEPRLYTFILLQLELIVPLDML